MLPVSLCCCVCPSQGSLLKMEHQPWHAPRPLLQPTPESRGPSPAPQSPRALRLHLDLLHPLSPCTTAETPDGPHLHSWAHPHPSPSLKTAASVTFPMPTRSPLSPHSSVTVVTATSQLQVPWITRLDGSPGSRAAPGAGREAGSRFSLGLQQEPALPAPRPDSWPSDHCFKPLVCGTFWHWPQDT